jgi:hypothetical protein
MSAVVLPPMSVVLPAKLLTRTVRANAIMFATFNSVEFAAAMFIPERFFYLRLNINRLRLFIGQVGNSVFYSYHKKVYCGA